MGAHDRAQAGRLRTTCVLGMAREIRRVRFLLFFLPETSYTRPTVRGLTPMLPGTDPAVFLYGQFFYTDSSKCNPRRLLIVVTSVVCTATAKPQRWSGSVLLEARGFQSELLLGSQTGSQTVLIACQFGSEDRGS